MEQMQRPKGKTFEEIERELGITKEEDDIRENYLGSPPSRKFYSGPEPDFERTRADFDRLMRRITKRCAKHKR